MRNPLVAVTLLMAMATGTAGATTRTADPTNYQARVAALVPGDVLKLAPGHYEHGLRLYGVHGTARRPIVIAGPRAGPPAIFTARYGHNTISLVDASHIEIRDLVLDGRGLEVAGVRAERSDLPVHHVALVRLVIVGHGPEQQTVAISTTSPALHWTIRDNVIVGAGAGMYLGGSDGSSPFVAGLIEGNLVWGTTGYNVQIKHQRPRGELQGVSSEPVATVLRGNVFVKTASSGTGSRARPNLLLGHFPLEGPGRDDLYVVEQNVFYANPTERLLQAEGNVAVRGNLFLNPQGDGIAIQPHNDVPRRIEIRDNFIASQGEPLRVVAGATPMALETERNEVLRLSAFTAAAGGDGAGRRQQQPLVDALRAWLSGNADSASGQRSRVLRALALACRPVPLRGKVPDGMPVIPADAAPCKAIEAGAR